MITPFVAQRHKAIRTIEFRPSGESPPAKPPVGTPQGSGRLQSAISYHEDLTILFGLLQIV
jgi:hypothetical protein